MPNNPHIIDEKDIDLAAVKAATIERPPITAGSPPLQEFDSFQGGVLNASFGLQTDIAASQIPGSLPTYRLQTLGIQANPVSNAAIQSTAINSAKAVIPSSANIELQAPDIFVETDQTVALPGPLVLVLADELPSTVFAGPPKEDTALFIDVITGFAAENSKLSLPYDGPLVYTWTVLPSAIPEFALFLCNTEGGAPPPYAPPGWSTVSEGAPIAGDNAYMGFRQTLGSTESVTITQNLAWGMSGILLTCFQTGTAIVPQPGVYQSVSFGQTTGAVSATFALPVSTNNAVFVGIIGGGKSSLFPTYLPNWTITDSEGNAYYAVDSKSAEGVYNQTLRTYTGLWCCGAVVGGSSFTVTATNTEVAWFNGVFCILEVAGLASMAGAKPTFRKLVGSDLPVFGPSGPNHAIGAVPDPGPIAGTIKYLREDATWDSPLSAAVAKPLAIFAPGVGTASQTLFRGALGIPMTFPAGASASLGTASTSATALTTFNFTQNGASPFATATFLAQFVVSSVAKVGTVVTYTGAFINVGVNALVDLVVTIAGFSHSGNNGPFTVISNTATTIVVANAGEMDETASATATFPANAAIFAQSGTVLFAASDVLEVAGPAVADVTLADVCLTLVGLG